MKKYIVVKHYSPVHGIIIETGSVVHVSEQRANRGLVCKMIIPASEEDKPKRRTRTKKEE
jgi:hypothetical protein